MLNILQKLSVFSGEYAINKVNWHLVAYKKRLFELQRERD